MKKKIYTTTEFYKNPSKALSFVKDGGIVYLGYKKMKDPIAVLTSIKDYTDAKQETPYKETDKSFLERFGKYSISSKKYTNATKYIRKQREQK